MTVEFWAKGTITPTVLGFRECDEPRDGIMEGSEWQKFSFFLHPTTPPWFAIELRGEVYRRGSWHVYCHIRHYGHAVALVKHQIGRGSGYETVERALLAAKQWVERELDDADWAKAREMENGFLNTLTSRSDESRQRDEAPTSIVGRGWAWGHH